MGRKAGGKNFGNFDGEPIRTVEVTETERMALSDIFTCIKAFFGYSATSSVPHRTDYYLYLARNFNSEKTGICAKTGA